MATRKIQHQVRLPWAVAFDVVKQGVRIRLGRSLVTLSGIVLGIAFLMSITAGELAQRSVAQEQQLRTEAKRMVNFLLAESGPLAGGTIGIIQRGPLQETESRFLQAILREKPQRLAWAESNPPPPAALAAAVHRVPLDHVADDAVAVLVVGDNSGPAIEWGQLLATARQKVVGLTRGSAGASSAGVVFASLAWEIPAEELTAMAADQKLAQFRTRWMGAIALVVTIIGIANSMLMSVTERFREIGTMKCLGALSAFIRRLFIIESSLMGVVGGVVGTLFGAVAAIGLYGITYNFSLVLGSLQWGLLAGQALLCVVAGIALAIVAAIYPATLAARMVPAMALRTNI